MTEYPQEQEPKDLSQSPEEELPGAEQVGVAETSLDTDQLIDNLQQELIECRAKSEEYLDGWQRARADFANYRKRVERDQSLVQQNATGSVVKRYLEIVDDLDRALKNRPLEGDGAAWANGVELIFRKFLMILESQGVQPMAPSTLFDPNLHEAITSEDSDHHASGEIIEIIQQGYLLGDRVLRPALVRVAR